MNSKSEHKPETKLRTSFSMVQKFQSNNFFRVENVLQGIYIKGFQSLKHASRA